MPGRWIRLQVWYQPVPNLKSKLWIIAISTLACNFAFTQETTPGLSAEEPSSQTTLLQSYYDDLVSNCLGDSPFWRKVTVAGYSNLSYTYHFNSPRNREIGYRAYDRIHNALLFNTIQLSASAASTTESRIGFGIKLNAGRNAEVFTPYEEATSDRIDIYEAWISYQIRESLLLKLGKMATLAGYESADEKDNYNISRGLLWSYLQPVTHTGARLVYTPEGKNYDLTFGVNRGWDTFRQDNNESLSYEGRIGYIPTDKLNFGLTYLTGPEGIDNNQDYRHLVDLVANYKVTDKTNLGLNFDLRLDNGSAPGGGTARSQGIAGYIKHEINDKTSIAARLEGMMDKGESATGEKQNLGSATVTVQRKFKENLLGRLEFRHDQSNASVFPTGDGPSRGQNTLAASLMFTF